MDAATPRPPARPRTPLPPERLARGFDAPPTIPLPKGYAASAIFSLR